MDIQEELNKIMAQCKDDVPSIQKLIEFNKVEQYPNKKSRLDCLLLIIKRDYTRKQGLAQEKLTRLAQIAEEFRNELNS